MIEIKDKKDCCGCWACHNACPKHCIEMEEDNEGFLYPQVNKEECIDCHLCEKVCPILNVELKNEPHEQEGYLLQHKDDDIRKESTSGGAFTAFATWVLSQGGIVFGGGFNEGTFTVVHQSVEKVEDLGRFRSSKYVQSSIGETYNEAKKALTAGRWVLFSGTPCQIEGLRCFLRKKDYEKLVLVDVVCRGVPSPLILRRYIEMAQKRIGGEFTKILFRDKYYGYHYSSFSIYNKDKSKDYHKGVDSNPYLRAFFNNLSDRPSCFSCAFRKRYRHSDLTIWDCFPIEKFTKKLDGKGTTRVLVQSEKGRRIMQAIKDDVRLVEVSPDKLTADVREMYHSVPMNLRREQFFMDCNSMEATAFFDKWFPMTWKVRLNAFVRLTCHRLGIYSLAKRLFMMVYTRKDERA